MPPSNGVGRVLDRLPSIVYAGLHNYINTQTGVETMPWARVLRSGQVTFPKEVRESLNLKEGDIVDFQIKGSEVVIRPKVMIDKGKAEVWKMFDEMREKMKDEDPRKIGTLIDEAVKETKKQRTAGKPRKRG